MVYCYKIGGLVFRVDTGEIQVNTSRSMEQFAVALPENAMPDYRVDCIREQLPVPVKVLNEDKEYTRYLTAQGDCFVACRYSSGGLDFGFYEADLETGCVRILCGNLPENRLPGMLNLLTRCGLHSLLLRRNMPVLHASFVNVEGSAVLFTGPSGTGKSTQAALWQTFAGAEIVNGDRALLCRAPGGWYACGYPASGSSRECLNRTLPVKAIILLEKGTNNVLQPAAPRNVFRLMTAGTELFRWSEKETDLVMKSALALAEEAAVYRFSCRPDVSAVEALKRIL